MAQGNVEAVAGFVSEVADYHEAYEADEFVVDVEGQRYYVERKRSFFIIHVGRERVRLPRC